MKKIYIFILINLLSICTIQAQCWFTQFKKDFETGSADFKKFIGESEDGMATYQRLYDGGSTYVLKNPTYLKKFEKLTPETQKLIAKFTDNASGSTLTKFLDDCDGDFITILNNSENKALIKGITSYKDDVILTLEEFEKIGEQLDLDEISKLNTWLKRSKDIERFKNYTALGRKLGDNITFALNNKSSNLFKKLKDKLKIDNLEQYEILNEIPLVTNANGGFMKADIVLVLRGGPQNSIQDVIILENKLSQGTDFTFRQKEGFEAILNGKTEFRLKYDREGLSSSKEIIKISKDKIYKIADHGKADDLDNLSIELIEKVN